MQCCLNFSLIFGYMGDGGALQIACFLFGTDASSGAIFVFPTPRSVAQFTAQCVCTQLLDPYTFSVRYETRACCEQTAETFSLLQLSFFELCSLRFETPPSAPVEQSSTRQRQEADPPEDPSDPSTSSSSAERSPTDMREPPEPKQARCLSPAEREDSTQRRQRPSEVERSVNASRGFQRKPNCSLDRRSAGKTRSNNAKSYETRPYEQWWK